MNTNMTVKKLILGLGNPEQAHINNRHNVGHLFCDYLKNLRVNGKNIIIKSNCYMNESGNFVLKSMRRSGLNTDNLFVVHDDLDIKIGEYKIQFAKGPKVHNGLNDIYQKLGTNEFWHIRIGVDNRSELDRQEGKDYVLSDFTLEEREILNNVFHNISKEL